MDIRRFLTSDGNLRKTMIWAGLFLLLAVHAAAASSGIHPEVRLKDIGRMEGVRSNQLVGMGLVLGLQGTGDKGDLVLAMLGNLAQNFGVVMDRDDLKTKNAAVVTVTCELPPFARSGEKVDVTISAVGEAKSLEGGVLLQTPLKSAGGEVYAVAQGPVSIGGFSAGASGSRLSKNISTTGRIPGGALVERETTWDSGKGDIIRFLLRDPDFTTADRITRVLNDRFGPVASAADAGCVEIRIPPSFRGKTSHFIAALEKLEITPDTIARVVINERTGTVAMGGDVKISEVAVAHGNLTVTIATQNGVSQPQPFSGGDTVELQQSTITAEEENGSLARLETSATVDDVVKSLNTLGATPRDIITILQAIDKAGALHGELVII